MSSNNRDYFAELDSYSSISSNDLIDMWFSILVLTNVDDGLGWWMAVDQTKHLLVKISLDFLSAPGMINIAIKLDNILIHQHSNINRCQMCILLWWSHCLEDKTFII